MASIPSPPDCPSQYTNNILGAECALFGEVVPSLENVMFKSFPREAAMAEITWTPLASQKLQPTSPTAWSHRS